MRKTIIITVVVVLVVAGLGYLGLQRLQKPSTTSAAALSTAQVRRGSLVATVSTAGTIESANSVSLVFQMAGQVKEVKAKVGDVVKAGQVLASVDATDAQLQVEQAEADLAVAQARLEQTKQGPTAEEIAAAAANLASAQESLNTLKAGTSASDLEIARLKLEQAKNQLWSAQAQRDATLGNPNASGASKDQAKASVNNAELGVQIAQLQYDALKAGPTAKDIKAAESQVAQAAANLAKLKASPAAADVLAAEASVKQAQVALDQAKRKLAQASLTAPIDGTITSLSLTVGQNVGTSAAVGTIEDLGSLQVAADMSEIDVSKVKTGQPVQITVDALPDRTFSGRVNLVAPAGTSTQGVVNYHVTLQLDKADPALRPGMTANLSIIVDQRDNVLLVPSRAVRTQNGSHIVRVAVNGQIIDVPVEIGMTGDSGVEILGDVLKEGDTVVLNTPTTTSAGARRIGGFMIGGRPMGD